jgi:short-subunit dehydrogenase
MRGGHSAAATNLLRDLDKELARSSEHHGYELVWSPQELEHLRMIAGTIDRREKVKAALRRADADDRKSLVAFSAEIRLLDAAVSRLLKCVSTDAPQGESLTTIKARRAVQARWDGERRRNGSGA